MEKIFSPSCLPIDLMKPLAACLGPGRSLFLVGGCLRDLALGRTPADMDIAATGDPESVARDLAFRCRGHWVRIGKGHQVVYRVVADKQVFDIAAAEGGNMAADLARRDFTINAMALDIASNTLLDPHGGMADLAAGKIRMVAPGVFDADPLRMLRAFRLCADLEFSLEAGTRERICSKAALIGQSAGERICAELFKLFRAPRSSRSIEEMERCGLLGAIFPELSALSHCLQSPPHDKDALAHTLAAYANLENLLAEKPPLLFAGMRLESEPLSPERQGLAKCAVLLHDIGKPSTLQTGPDGRIRFHGHEQEGAKMADAAARRLAFSNRRRRHVTFLVEHHLRPLSLFLAWQRKELSQRGITRFFRTCGPLVPDLFLHAAADMTAKAPAQDQIRAFFIFSRQILGQEFQVFQTRQKRPALLNGNDLINALGMVPSPDFRRILDAVEEARLAGRINTRAQALALAQKLQSIS